MVRETASSGTWQGARLHIVTGKGGTGKTTVAAAIALALAGGGRRTLLVEIEGRQGIPQLFDTPPLPHEERRVAVAPGGGEVHALAVDAGDALLDYLARFYRLGRARWVLERIGALDFATTIAPGLRDVFVVGSVVEAVTRTAERDGYDSVVVDAPATGRVVRVLNVNGEVGRLAGRGPIRDRAEAIMAVLRSETTVVHFVTVLEEMPTQEVLDSVSALGQVGIRIGGVIVNKVRPALLTPDELTLAARARLPRARISGGLAAAGISASTGLVRALIEEATAVAQEDSLGTAERATLQTLHRPTYDLPWLHEGVDLGGLYTLAGNLTAQGFR